MASRDHSIECGVMPTKRWASCPLCWSQCHYEEFTAMGERDVTLVGPDCLYCENLRGVTECLDVLAHNLVWGAMLCRSYEMGANPPPVGEDLYIAGGIVPAPDWHPGHAITRASAQMEETVSEEKLEREYAEDQAVMREADDFLAEQGVVVRQEPVVPDRLAYRAEGEV